MGLARLAAFVAHGFRLAWSYKLNFVARYVSILISVVFFYFLDRLFQATGTRVVEGGSYFVFLLIGGTITRYLDLTMGAFAQNLREEMLRGTIEPLLSTATPLLLALLGPSAWMLLEGTLAAGLQLGLGVLFGADFARANWPSALLVVAAGLLCLICYGILSAAFTLVFKRSDPLNWLLGAIVYVLGGVYFPVDTLPPALRALSRLLPFTYAVRGLRGALMQGHGLAQLGRDLLALLAFTTVLLPLSLWSLRVATRHLKRTGQLGYY